MAVSVHLSPAGPHIPVVPGEAAHLTLTLHNAGDRVTEYRITLTGLDASWYTLSHSSLALFPGDREQVQVTLAPPRSSESRAGTYPAALSVTSSRDPADRAELPLEVEVRPFLEYELDMNPRLAGGRGAGRYRLTLSNLGGVDATFALKGWDPEEALSFRFAEPEVAVPPGETREVLVEVAPKKRAFIGTPVRRTFKITAEAPGSAAHSVEAQHEARPLVSPLVMQVATGGAIALLLVGGAIAFAASRSRDDTGAVATLTPTPTAAPTPSQRVAAVTDEPPPTPTPTPTPTPEPEPTDEPTPTPTPTPTLPPIPPPELAVFQPTGWTGPLVVSSATGFVNPQEAASIYTADELYVSWAVRNNGSTPTASGFTVALLVDDQEVMRWEVPALAPGATHEVRYAPIGKLALGDRDLRLVIDTGDAVAEGDEQNNTVARSYSVQEPPDIPPSVRVSLSATVIPLGKAVDVSAAVSDPDPGDPLSWMVDWGDGTPVEAGSLPGGGDFTVRASHTYAQAGKYQVVVKVCDSHDECREGGALATVNTAPTAKLDLSATTVGTGKSVTASVAATDPDGEDPLTWTVDWGDGSAPSTGNLPGGGSGTAQATHTYAKGGDYQVALKVCDSRNACADATVTLTVSTTPTVKLDLSASVINVNSSLKVALTITDPDQSDPVTWTLDWGDGNPRISADVAGGGTQTVTQAHTYAQAGQFKLVAQVCDSAKLCQEATATLTVNTPPTLGLKLSATAVQVGQSLTAAMSITDPDKDDGLTWTVDWGDKSTPAKGSLAGSGSFSPQASHAYQKGGQYTVTAQVCDSRKACATQTATVTANTPPTSLEVAVESQLINSTTIRVTLKISFIDPDADDPHVVTVNWGPTTNTYNLRAGQLSTAVSHDYSIFSPPRSGSIVVKVCDSYNACIQHTLV